MKNLIRLGHLFFKLESEVVPAPVNVMNGMLRGSPKVRAVKWHKNGLHVLTVTTVVGFIVHQNVGKFREDIKKLQNATALKVIGT